MSFDRKSDLSFFARERPDGRIGFWWMADDSDTWAAAKTDLKVNFPHHTGLRYDGNEREWTVPRHSIDKLQRWANAWASHQAWDAARRGDHQSGTERPQHAPGASLASAYRALYLLPDAPLWACEAVYRAAQKHAHPDAGGDHTQAVALNTAIQTIREVQGLQARAS